MLVERTTPPEKFENTSASCGKIRKSSMQIKKKVLRKAAATQKFKIWHFDFLSTGNICKCTQNPPKASKKAICGRVSLPEAFVMPLVISIIGARISEMCKIP